MRRLAVLPVVLLMLAGCGTPDEAPRSESSVIPMDFGDDERLDRLWAMCAVGNENACFDLRREAVPGSEYVRFADEVLRQGA